jgi:hypothetical protein
MRVKPILQVIVITPVVVVLVAALVQEIQVVALEANFIKL